MVTRVLGLCLLTVGALLAGCEREPVRTVVIPPRPAVEAPAAPAVAVPAQPQSKSQPQATAPATVPAPSAPTAQMGAAADPAPQFSGDPGDLEGARFLVARSLMVPVVGVPPRALMDNFEQDRGSRKHEAMDIVAPAGTPVVAVDNGRIAKLFNSKPGGLTVYQFDADGRLAYYYAHLDKYADDLREGMEVRRGTVLGYVGTSGNADPKVPHLHFAVFKLGPERQWWRGEPVNPYPAFRLAAPADAVAAR